MSDETKTEEVKKPRRRRSTGTQAASRKKASKVTKSTKKKVAKKATKATPRKRNTKAAAPTCIPCSREEFTFLSEGWRALVRMLYGEEVFSADITFVWTMGMLSINEIEGLPTSHEQLMELVSTHLNREVNQAWQINAADTMQIRAYLHAQGIPFPGPQAFGGVQ